MAIVKNNTVTQGFSGMLNDLIVFRQLHGKTIVAKRPRPARRQSDLQRANRTRFRNATRFAKAAMYDPKKKAFYWEKALALGLPNAYTAAITEYMRRGKSTVDRPQSTVEESRFMNHGHATISQPLTSSPALAQPAVDCGPWTMDSTAPASRKTTLERWTWTISGN